MKIAHLTSVHPRYDTRIFFKECISLSKNSFNVSLIVADGKGNEVKDNVNIVDVGKPNNRFFRILITTFKIYRAALKTKSKIFHFHDPELLFVGLFLIILHRKKVIYDIHEDYTKTIKERSWLGIIAKITASIFGKVENRITRLFSANIIVLDLWKKKYKNTIVIKNYPKSASKITSLKEKNNDFLYVGSLSDTRGIVEMVKIFKQFSENKKTKLHIVGVFSNEKIEKTIKSLVNDKIILHGYRPVSEVADLLSKSKFGFCLYTQKKFEENIPVKMYEYLSYSTPVICTNFKSWKERIDKESWGVNINPFDIESSVEKITKAFDRETYEKLYHSCQKYKDNYTWKNEEYKLIEIYNKLIK